MVIESEQLPSRVHLRSFFLPDAAGGYRHCTLLAPAAHDAKALVLHAHALGAELNCARRQVTQAARALAAAGASVLLVDLLGCGDSSGETDDADWDIWECDLQRAAAWLQQSAPRAPLWWWGLRAGALSAAPACASAGGSPHLLWWQPVLDGEDLHRHWQRQVLSAAIAEGREAQSAIRGMNDAWQAGGTVDIAGDAVSCQFAQAARARTVRTPQTFPEPGLIAWIDVAPRPSPSPAPASAETLQAFRARGWQVDWRAVQGPRFWLDPEAGVSTALAEATVHAVLGEPHRT